jgi:hypothetical protein
MNQIQIVCEAQSPRLAYIAQIVFGQLLGLKIEYTNAPSSDFPVLYYSKKPPITTVLWLEACDILFETDIKTTYLQEKISYFEYDVADFDWQFNQTFFDNKNGSMPILFPIENTNSCLPFDVLAASFYLISRYEEYIRQERDAHGRFEARQSIANNHFLHLPIVEYWATLLAQKLQTAFPSLHITRPKGRVLPTFDIDMAWAFRHKTPLQHLGGAASDIIKLNFKRLKYRIEVLSKQQPDPFFTFEKIEHILKNSTKNDHASIFFLLGKYGKYDKNTPIDTPEFKDLILRLSQKHHIGVHPSYRSNMESGRLGFEINTLSTLIQKNITHSRQHFLKLSLPETYQNLIKNGITHDCSMGYAEDIGFRAGISQPFLWFDLSENKARDLTIQPFCIMDVTLRHYLRRTPEQAILLKDFIKKTAQMGGQVVLLWHNSSLSNWEEWAGWQDVLSELLDANNDINSGSR